MVLRGGLYELVEARKLENPISGWPPLDPGRLPPLEGSLPDPSEV